MTDDSSVDSNGALANSGVTTQYLSVAPFITKNEWGRTETTVISINPQQDVDLSCPRFKTHSAWGDDSSPHDGLLDPELWCNCAD
ncbi:MAG: hypothetical protein IAF00_03140 [Phycisphaerales bacterium]|nr:hypothetical protein [Phycisphaerales bacterium]